MRSFFCGSITFFAYPFILNSPDTIPTLAPALAVGIKRPRVREEMIRLKEYLDLKEYLIYTLREKLKRREVA